MKVLHLEQDMEKSLHAICDSALKGGGMALHTQIQQVLSAIVSQENQSKYIEIEEEIDKALYIICDSALKLSGMSLHDLVQKLISSIQEEESEEITEVSCD